MKRLLQPLILIGLLCSSITYANLVDTVSMVKPSVVGIGIYTPTGRQKNQLNGTGFVVGD